jgi:hypothetical protein
MSQKRYLRPPAAAEYIGSSTSTLAKKRLTGDGPSYSLLGGIVIYDVADLDAWVAAHRRQSTSENKPTDLRHGKASTPSGA